MFSRNTIFFLSYNIGLCFSKFNTKTEVREKLFGNLIFSSLFLPNYYTWNLKRLGFRSVSGYYTSLFFLPLIVYHIKSPATNSLFYFKTRHMHKHTQQNQWPYIKEQDFNRYRITEIQVKISQHNLISHKKMPLVFYKVLIT